MSLSEVCAQSLIESACMKALLSKVLGYTVITGAVFYKIPQITSIIKKRSVQGLALSMYLLELLCFSITLAYNVVNGYAFSTYGEYVFMIIQTGIILVLFFHYNNKLNPMFFGGVLLWLVGFSALVFGLVPFTVLQFLQTFTIPLFMSSRIPQIWLNFKNKGCGTLNFITVFMQVSGAGARVFTTFQEVDDWIMIISVVMGFVLNLTLLVQIVFYNMFPAKIDANKKRK